MFYILNFFSRTFVLEGERYVVKNTTFMMLPYLLSLAQENVFIFRKALSPWMSE